MTRIITAVAFAMLTLLPTIAGAQGWPGPCPVRCTDYIGSDGRWHRQCVPMCAR